MWVKVSSAFKGIGFLEPRHKAQSASVHLIKVKCIVIKYYIS